MHAFFFLSIWRSDYKAATKLKKSKRDLSNRNHFRCWQRQNLRLEHECLRLATESALCWTSKTSYFPSWAQGYGSGRNDFPDSFVIQQLCPAPSEQSIFALGCQPLITGTSARAEVEGSIVYNPNWICHQLGFKLSFQRGLSSQLRHTP